MNRIITILISFFFFTQLYANDKVEKNEKLNVLVFSKTTEYRHQSISNGIKMLSELAQESNWEVTATENSEFFNNDFLKRFDVVVFLNPSGDVLTDKQQKAFQNHMKSGKGFVGIHSSADCEYEWEWYGELNGAYFESHPPSQIGTVIFEDYDHPAMEAFKEMKTYTTFDEWYTFKANPRENVNVLARLDESSIKEAENDDWKMGDHPLIWWQEYDGIRSFYTVFGHTAETFDDPNIRQHIAGAIEWAGKRTD